MCLDMKISKYIKFIDQKSFENHMGYILTESKLKQFSFCLYQRL